VVTSARVWRARGLRALAVSVVLLLGLGVAVRAGAYETPSRLSEVARAYSLGVGEVRCASQAEWQADPYSSFHWGYTNVRADYTVLPPLICEGALNVAHDEVPAWERALGTLVLVHEAFHLRHWPRRGQGRVPGDRVRHRSGPETWGERGRGGQPVPIRARLAPVVDAAVPVVSRPNVRHPTLDPAGAIAAGTACGSDGRSTYLVGHYWPGVDVDELDAAMQRARAVVWAGRLTSGRHVELHAAFGVGLNSV